MIKNPNTPLRAGYIAAIKSDIPDTPVWAKKVPRSISPLPAEYILITSQTLNRTAIGKDCWEWLCSIVVDIVFQGPLGFSNTEKVDTIEEKVINAIESNLQVEGFQVKSVDLVQSITLDAETPTQSVERRVLTYEHWVCQE
jgi:hypothetical protein